MKHFLTAAEIVLSRFKIPMKVKDIVDFALEQGVLRSSGKTPVNTMRARLSEHIRKNKEQSHFIRVSSNKFALREWDVDEYISPEFKKSIDNERVVAIKQSAFDEVGRFFGFSREYEPYLKLLDRDNLVILNRDKANNDYSVKQIVSYVIIKNVNNEILAYTRGSYSSTKDKLLEGVLCIGFGGHVNEEDYNDLFGIEDGGIRNSVYRELNEELRDIKFEEPRLIGVINDDSSPLGLNHFAFVFITKNNNDDLNKISAELSINKLQYLTPKILNEKFYKLEFWSQLLVKNLFDVEDIASKIIIKEKKRHLGFPLIVVGEIGSGKSELSKIISRKLQIHYLSTREIVSEILKLKDFGVNNRIDFQNKALKLIKRKHGCKMIAEEIIKKINEDKKVVIDGVRNIETLSFIKLKYPDSTLIYVDLSVDDSYNFFSERSKRSASINEFREVRFHEVEKEIVLFKNKADVYVYNGASFNELVNTITEWIDEKNSISN